MTRADLLAVSDVFCDKTIQIMPMSKVNASTAWMVTLMTSTVCLLTRHAVHHTQDHGPHVLNCSRLSVSYTPQ